MLQTYSMSSPEQLWMNHKENLSEDILHQTRILQQNMDLDYCDIFNRALIDIDDTIVSLGGSDLKSFEFPQANRNRDSVLPSEECIERNYDTDVLTTYVEENEPKMVEDQKEAFDKIAKAVFDRCSGIFLDAPGGAGKTFQINFLLAKVGQRNEISPAVASSGITTTLLTKERTAHMAFRLPLNQADMDTPTCNISRNS
ncbi:hypothetical protein AVEN_19207-1 [Araneus ventricosus]|uniref:ATP-dependent DNA helicase n=1 Tax=Araneus ventricosus TaxID=182803 RepID=A0A4Y2TD26_ARAVE|nr:hypothetical protein AVEN_19207-1 [Araneus ventricosus]